MRGEVKWKIVSWLRSKWLWATKLGKISVDSKIYVRHCYIINESDNVTFLQHILEFKALKKILHFNFFRLRLCYPFDEIIINYFKNIIIIFLKKTTGMYFSVIPDNAHDLLRSWHYGHSLVFYETIFWPHRSHFIFYMLLIMPVEY